MSPFFLPSFLTEFTKISSSFQQCLSQWLLRKKDGLQALSNIHRERGFLRIVVPITYSQLDWLNGLQWKGKLLVLLRSEITENKLEMFCCVKKWNTLKYSSAYLEFISFISLNTYQHFQSIYAQHCWIVCQYSKVNSIRNSY